MIAEALPKVETTKSLDIDWSAFAPGRSRSTYLKVRYGMDWAAALILLVLLSPVMLVIALAIRLDSEGPVFFRQVRAGRFAEPFTIIKFRTMQTSAPRSSIKMSEFHPYVTRVGRILRKTGLDEVPQLFNVLCGDMVLIGPRPEQIGLLPLYQLWEHERHLLKPGITGWWQVHHRDNVPMHFNVDKDIHYVRHVNPVLDANIVLGTIKVLLSPLIGRLQRRRLQLDAERGDVELGVISPVTAEEAV